MKTKLYIWLPVLIWMAVIFTFSSQPDLPSNQIDLLDFIFKKSAHMIEFGVLVFLLSRAYQFTRPASSFLIALSYAFTDEIHQLFVPGRGGKVSDVFIDLLGIIIATKLISRHSGK
jgi:VanZ family protein